MKKTLFVSCTLLLAGLAGQPANFGCGLSRTARADALDSLAASSAQPKQEAALAADGDAETFWVSGAPSPKPGQGPTRESPQWIEFRFRTPVTVRSLEVSARPGYGPRQGEVQASGDGQIFRTIAPFQVDEAAPDSTTVTFAPTSARVVRLVVFAAFDPRFPDAPRNVQVAEVRLAGQDGDGKDATWPSGAARPGGAAGPRLPRPALVVTPVKPQRFEKRGGKYLVDFGRDAFGNLQLTLPAATATALFSIRLGEKLGADGAIDRAPGGSINFQQLSLQTQPGQSVYRLQIPIKKGAQSNPQAIRVPAHIGNITPFRYAEIEGAEGAVALDESNVRQLFVHTAFDDSASSFRSSDPTLDAVWELCKHTMKASTAFGVYIDGERERLPYEADAYINQLSHWASDLNPEVARHSVEFLLAHPTWPTEWSFHMPMMAAADYEATGDLALAARHYEALRKKLLLDKARADGLLVAKPIIDWPAGERDGFDGGDVNISVNAFHYHALRQMEMLARALKKDDEARELGARAQRVYEAINRVFFSAASGLYIDGEGSAHSSLHANMFPLAFGLVPAERQAKVADFVQSRGMACSVYGAQYLLEALYKAGRDDAALRLMASRSERSWWHMIALGSTMTLEAWDAKFKPNLTWNHAWGAAPANIIARYLVGVRPAAPGSGEILVAPRPGTLKSFEAKVPTARGPVLVALQNGRYQIEVPPNTKARVALPGRKEEVVGAGKHVFEAR